MMKLVLVSGLAFLCGVSFTTRAGADDLLPSHAYLYTQSTPSIAEDYVEIIIQQLGNVRFLNCQTGGNPLPSTPDGLTNFISSSCGKIPVGLSNFTGFQGIAQLFHESAANRFILMIGEVAWGPNTAGMNCLAKVAIFDPNDTDTVNVTGQGLLTLPGKNPGVGTETYSEIKAYDADIEYPVITEQPIQQ
jgi:hypothetical protein